MKNKAVIFLNGNLGKLDFTKSLIDDSTYLIGCDGGTDRIYDLGYKPNAVIGDFDSLKKLPKKIKQIKSVKTGSEQIVDEVIYRKYPTDKDFLDTELAIDFAIQKSFSEIILVNTLGDETDHMLGTIFLIGREKFSDINIKIIQQNQEISIISGIVEIHGNPGQKISLIPIFGEVKVASSTGLKYDPAKYKMTMETNAGISNEFTKTQVYLKIKSGKFLAIIHHRHNVNL